MQSGDDLPSHGVYGAGRAFKQWCLGDFTSTDDVIQDYTDEPTGSGWGQINKYTVDITGYTSVHFDVFNHVENRTRSSFNPFSHDGEVDVPKFRSRPPWPRLPSLWAWRALPDCVEPGAG
jgi:hypothetical protein